MMRAIVSRSCLLPVKTTVACSLFTSSTASRVKFASGQSFVGHLLMGWHTTRGGLLFGVI
jgi:hypothetical protein